MSASQKDFEDCPQCGLRYGDHAQKDAGKGLGVYQVDDPRPHAHQVFCPRCKRRGPIAVPTADEVRAAGRDRERPHAGLDGLAQRRAVDLWNEEVRRSQ